MEEEWLDEEHAKFPKEGEAGSMERAVVVKRGWTVKNMKW